MARVYNGARLSDPGVRAAFTRMWQGGKSVAAIRAEFGIGATTVKLWRDRLGLSARAKGKVPVVGRREEAAFRRAWNGGRTARDIAAQFGLTEAGVYKARKRLGLPRRANPRRHGMDGAVQDRFRMMWRADLSFAVLEQAFDIGSGTVVGLVDRLGLPRRRKSGPTRAKKLRNQFALAWLDGVASADLDARYGGGVAGWAVAEAARIGLPARADDPVVPAGGSVAGRVRADGPHGSQRGAARKRRARVAAGPVYEGPRPCGRWTAARDAALIDRGGSHAARAELAAAWGVPMAAVTARWHLLRAAAPARSGVAV